MSDTYLTCSFCHHRFTQEESAVSCGKCSLFGAGGCKKLRCPQCGYEMPPPPRLPGVIAKLFKKP